jgi:hypothetical protein
MGYLTIIMDENQNKVWTAPDLIDDLGKAVDAAMDKLASWADIPGWPLEIWVMEGYYGKSIVTKNVTQEEAKKYRDETNGHVHLTEKLNLALGTRDSLYKFRVIGPVGKVYSLTGAVIHDSGFQYASPDAAHTAGMKYMATDGNILSGKNGWPLSLETANEDDEQHDRPTSQEAIWEHTINYYAVERINMANAEGPRASIAFAEGKCKRAKEQYESGILTPYDYSSTAEQAWSIANGEIRSALHMDD